MYFLHAPEIREKFPQLQAGCIVVNEVSPDIDVSVDVDAFYKKASEKLQENEVGQMPEIMAWRKVFSEMGLKPTKYRCAAESLLRRFSKDGSFPKFHPLIDLCNAFSMAYAIPIAVIDADNIVDGIRVDVAKGDEDYLEFSGEITHPEANEVAFIDQGNSAHSRRWCYRQSKRSVVTPSTKRVLIVVEAMHQTASQDVQDLIQTLSKLFEKYNLTVEQSTLLSNQNPQITF